MTHDERISSERADMFPLLLMSNHPRWRMHAQGDDITWARETPTGKVLGFDGYKYEPIWIHPMDAAARGIKHGDIVKIFNERGVVLGGACVWERIMPGVVYIDHGARDDPIIPGKVDRGGAINTIAPHGLTSKNCCGQATSGYPGRGGEGRGRRSGRRGAGTIPKPSSESTTRCRPALRRLGRRGR